MLRRPGACVGVLALLSGLLAAPYTHAHQAIDSVTDGQHPQGRALIHTHATAHEHHDGHDAGPGDSEADGSHETDRIWSVASFLFQQPSLAETPAPALVEFLEEPPILTRAWLGPDRPQPTAHGPPLGLSSPLRAPPVLLPQFS